MTALIPSQTRRASWVRGGNRPRRTLIVAIAVAAAASLSLTGCATGQRAQTAIETPVIDGVGADVGTISIRALTIVSPANGSYPSGGTAALQLYIVNTGAPDQLVSVSSPSAKSASLFTSGATEFSIPPTSAAPTPTPTPTPTTSTPTATSSSKSTSKSSNSGSASATESTTTAEPSTSTASSPATSTSPSAPPVTITLASGETTAIGVAGTNPQIMLVGLDAALYPAMSIPITFTFANAGSVTVEVSVHLSTGAVNAPTLATSHDTDDE